MKWPARPSTGGRWRISSSSSSLQKNILQTEKCPYGFPPFPLRCLLFLLSLRGIGLSAKIIVFFHLILVSKVTAATEYRAPQDCEWTKLYPSGTDVALTCRIHAIGSTVRETNFSDIQADHTVRLTIVCDEVFYESRLTNMSLAHLHHLKALTIDRCKFSDIPDKLFHGLAALRNLTISTRNTDWGTMALKLEGNTFSNTRELEYLDLSFNNIVTLPQYPFCGLITLKLFNLSNNRLPDLKILGLEERKLFPCLPDLNDFDLSHNRIKIVGDEVFSSLRKLKILRLNDNKISRVSPYALLALNKLQLLYLSNNQLSNLPSQFFQHSHDLREIHLQNNSISSLPPGLFRGLQQLVVLNLSHNTITSLVSSTESLSDLIRLVILDLSYNNQQAIDEFALQAMQSLQVLYLNHNRIDVIADNAFSSLVNLHTLILNNNKLKSLGMLTLNGLTSLSFLSINENEVETINQEAFKNCTNIQNLRMKGNKMSVFPTAVGNLVFLKHLDMAHNAINDITNVTFAGLKHLVSLQLSKNFIGNLTRGTFRDLLLLKTLDLSHNKIQSLEHGIFDDAPELHGIRLNDNLLTDINGLFMNLRYMNMLNVSRNKITWFDYALIPAELHVLDIHDNEIDALGNYFELETAMQLRSMDVSYNILKEINAASFPNRLESVRLNNNRIKVINSFTFMAKTNLSSVDLKNNSIQTLDINAFRLKTMPGTRRLPEFSVSENPYFCDCTMEWLQRINDLDETRQYPRIVDLDQVICQIPFPRGKSLLPIVQARPSDFLCKYKSHCFALCHCCEFDACDCEMVCPENCTCYSDQTWNTNIVDCGASSHVQIPGRIPMDVTELYLDGNDMSQLSSHSFIGRKNMKVLYLNNSNIYSIRNRTFNGLQNLYGLHLESNKISVLQGHEFTNLTHLRELYLSHNRLNTISNTSFTSLKFLQVLHLDHNAIAEFQVWNLNYNHRLMDVRLGFNSWTCKCQFLENFQDWVIVFGDFISDRQNIRCFHNNTAGLYLLEFNSSRCSNYSAVSVFQAEFVEDYMPVMIIAPSFLLLTVFVLVVICIYRNEMKIWVYSRYGIRLFQRNNYSSQTEKLFDAFLSYCKKDEAFVAQILAPELECGNPPYRLCLRYRDLPMASYVAEAISEAIECSHRTIAVVSEQFLKSEWCRFELKTAHHESQCNKHHRLIVVLLDKISFKELDPDCRLCLRSSVIIHWGERRFWEKLRYSMPDERGHRNHVNSQESKLSSLRRSSLSNSIKLV